MSLLSSLSLAGGVLLVRGVEIDGRQSWWSLLGLRGSGVRRGKTSSVFWCHFGGFVLSC